MNDANLEQRLRRRLTFLYGDRAETTLHAILERIARAGDLPRRETLWDHRDTVLITYGDQVRCDDHPPLRCLRRFLADAGMRELLSTVHLLPFFPYSSDDGFSVIDFRRVDPALGDWSDVDALGEDYALMFDLVLNHVSRRGEWFRQYVAGVEPYTRYFIEGDPKTDLSQVVRPRSTPLLTPVETSRGVRHVWTTFSDDQIDLNYAEPAVLLEMIDVLLAYIGHGARIVRLDAIAYLWKEPGTSCIHLPQTHEVVKLLRDLVDAVAPGTILLTETNVPHEENISYFGNGDEARMVYQFSLAPLLLEAILSGDATVLVDWLMQEEGTRGCFAEKRPVSFSPPGTTVLNFTASHDGIGVRPLEGILPPERFRALIDAVRDRGGHVSTKRNPDGTDTPYELNITYFDALRPVVDGPTNDALHARRFLAGQAVMLALKGIPGIYFHSLVGTPNDIEGVKRTGRARSINRRKFDADELHALLAADAPQRHVLEGYRRLLAVRTRQPAFHPDGPQQVVRLAQPGLLGFFRQSPDGGQTLLVLANLGPKPALVDLRALAGNTPVGDLLGGDLLGGQRLGDTLELLPYQVAWVEL